MSSKRVHVVDYGLGNLLSVGRALEAVGVEPVLTASPKEIEGADRVVLPGVGAFGAGMDGLRAIDMVDALKSFAFRERPLLGICLGMQMLLEKSEEFGLFDGLGLVPGRVRKLPEKDEDGNSLRVPHIGWSRTSVTPARVTDVTWGVTKEHYFYFVHSFYADPSQSEDVALTIGFGGASVPVGIHRKNVLGVQFHLEKSGEAGLDLLRTFIEL